MKTVEECVVNAMDGSDKELFYFLPYILQDIWEIGTDPEIIIKMIRRHFTKYDNLRVLDLGCGKGAVSVKLSLELGCFCLGIDAIAEFIIDAQKKALEYKVDHLCNFISGDIREKIKELKEYDIVILGSIGPVLGDYYTTLTSLSHCCGDSGIFIIDDGYVEDDYSHHIIIKKRDLLQQISRAGMRLINEEIISHADIKNNDDFIFEKLKKRCMELINIYPDKKPIFENYICRQVEENEVLEKYVVCSTMIIKKC